MFFWKDKHYNWYHRNTKDFKRPSWTIIGQQSGPSGGRHEWISRNIIYQDGVMKKQKIWIGHLLVRSLNQWSKTSEHKKKSPAPDDFTSGVYKQLKENQYQT